MPRCWSCDDWIPEKNTELPLDRAYAGQAQALRRSTHLLEPGATRTAPQQALLSKGTLTQAASLGWP